MAIISMRITYGTSKVKPRVGDTKIVKGITYIRQLKYVFDHKGVKLGLDCTGGKQRYEWVATTPNKGE